MVKRIQKQLSCLLVVVLLLGTGLMSIPTSVHAAPGFAGGSGSTEDPYQIATAEQLAMMRNYLNSDFILMNNIDLTAYLAVGGAGWRDGEGWVPVGDSEVTYSGTFDGQGYTITGLMINRPSANNQGLFGIIASDTIIKNVGLIDVNIIGASKVGGLAGYNLGTITNSFTSGYIEGQDSVGGLVGFNSGTITTSFSSGNVEGLDAVGGLVGDGSGDFTNSYATGDVTSTSSDGNAGGLVGRTSGTITKSYSTGKVTSTTNYSYIGGLLGSLIDNIVINSYYDKQSSGQSDEGKGDGKTNAEMKQQGTYGEWDFDTIWSIDAGEYPRLQSIDAAQQPDAAPPTLVSATVEDVNPNQVVVTFDEDVAITGTTGITIHVEDNDATVTQAVYDWGTHEITFTIDHAIEFGENVTITYSGSGTIVDSAMNPPPAFTESVINNIQVFDNGDGSTDHPYQIETATQLAAMNDHLTSHFILMNDLDLTAYLAESGAGWNDGAGWVPIGNSTTKFSGTFDGQGYTITGLMINRPSADYQGLFGYIGYINSPMIKNVGLIDVNVTGLDDVGGLAGYNSGTITNSFTSGNVEGRDAVGGLVGYNGANITSSFSSVNVEGQDSVGGLVGSNTGPTSDSYATGEVMGNDNVGGLAGGTTGSIMNVFSTGKVTTGNPSISTSIGGLIGWYNDTSITNSYYDKDTTGQSDTGKGDSKTTAEIKQQGTFVEWDFETIWSIDEGITYPRLRSIAAEYQPDSAAPTIVSATVMDAQPNQVVVTFNEAVTINSEASMVEFTVDNTAVMTGSPSGAGTNVLTFTLSGDISKGQIVQMSDGGTGYFTDLAQNPLLIGNTSISVDNQVGIYTVSFELNGGSPTMADISVVEGETLAKPSLPKRTGFTFDGWFADPGFTTEFAFWSDKVEGNLTLYAKWVWKTTPQLKLGDQSGNAGATVEVPLTLTFGETVVGITFDLTVTSDLLDFNPLLVDGVMNQYNEVSEDDSLETYHFLIGTTNSEEANSIIPSVIGNLQFKINEKLVYASTAKVTLSNIRFSDASGNETDYSGNVVGIITVADSNPPTLSLPDDPSSTDYATTVEVIVTSDGTGSGMKVQKWASATDVPEAPDDAMEWFKSNGTAIDDSSFVVTENGTFTAYVEDAAGNGAIATINITNIVSKGDVIEDEAGEIVITDWQKTANFILKKDVPDARQTFTADMNGDGVITVGDWVLLANLLLE